MTWVVEFHPDFEPELVAGDKSGSSESLFYKQLVKTADTRFDNDYDCN